MPICTLTTNLPPQDISDEFLMDLARKLAAFLNKPFSKMKMIVHPNIRMMLETPTSLASLTLEIRAMKSFPVELTEPICSAMRTFINSELGVQKERIWLIFQEMKPEQLGMAKVPVYN